MRYLWLVAAILTLIIGWGLVERHESYLRKSASYQRITRRQLTAIADYLRDFAKKTGQYPSPDQGLLALDALKKDHADFSSDHRLELMFICVAPSGLLSPYRDPFVYENRRGLPAAAFADSPANSDTRGTYSIRVDDGIYVWCLGAKQRQAYLDNHHWRPYLARAIVIVGAAMCLIIFLRRCVLRALGVQKWWRKSFSLLQDGVLGFVLLIPLAAFFMPLMFRACYRPCFIQPRRQSLTDDYAAVMTKYRDRGVISSEACAKLISALKDDESAEDYIQ